MLYRSSDITHVDQWFQDILAEEKPPNEAQLQAMRMASERCAVEAAEEVEERINEDAAAELVRAMVHAIPGAGKTQVIKWICRFRRILLGGILSESTSASRRSTRWRPWSTAGPSMVGHTCTWARTTATIISS